MLTPNGAADGLCEFPNFYAIRTLAYEKGRLLVCEECK